MPLQEIQEFLQQQQIPFEMEVPLSRYCTFRIGGPAALLARPKNAEQAVKVFSMVRQQGIALEIIGKGSNLLVSDQGFPGVILWAMGLDEMQLLDNTRIRCGAGVSLANLCKMALEHALSGLEFAYGIPGSVGGAVFMNAGAYGGEICNCLESCTFFNSETGELQTLSGKDLEFSYRHSRFSRTGELILEVVFRLEKDDKQVIQNRMEEYIFKRTEKQPLEYPSAGSTFKRPAGAYAAALIEECGLKGLRVGGAQVSMKHSGFLINTGGATCKDVEELIQQVQEKVMAQTGFQLECEVRRIGSR